MNLKKEAALLTEKIFHVRGSNQANVVQELIYEALHETYNKGLKEGLERNAKL